MISDIHIQAILDASHDGIIAVDHDYTIIWVNQNATEILGLPSHVVGEKITRYIPNSDMLRILATGKKEIGDIATVLNRQIIINRLPIVVNGEIVGAVSTFKEITDIQKMEMRIRKQSMESGLEAKFRLEDIVGHSKAMQEAKEWAETFARTDATVLIQGESGTGKELFAQGIHLSSQRATGPFIAVNCAALPGNLLESELFGYEEGAFTGARKGGKPGLFELAHGGTLFLDEIGEMSITIQALLLRVLQEKKVRRVSGERIVPVDVRIIAATNRNLEQMMEEKLFRSDLYYRLNVLTLELPPLRERTEDIPLLMEAIMEEIAQRGDRRLQGVDEAVYHFLGQYDWPGNVRELRNVVERMVLLCKSDYLRLEDTQFLSKKLARKQALRQQQDDEEEMIRKVLEATKGNKREAAKMLGMDRTTLWRKMKKYEEWN
ncbi:MULTISPECIES: sigma-54 interaction domain-containing protein [Brevibacillus]|jgi:Transcriptional regulator containing PAS, AAA-type ATPase, and DNA-binding domains|uniref:Sigma-54-dependent Fis family transcriptional regulator n=1 Tax=Brevibacillus parabrevis TaxID=54914 RepID=A0A4Y3PJ82_BREPA|nr:MULTISPECIES: sigma 54-interacting transcriptional regulator [Brevibacillus]MDH6349346.1 PAS domain S-box-containing protein [Brevibacillus sp. 1238]MED1724320.1 sigma 54-interacting transcriptional regulator [Brevibacillus parabrevis]NRQ52372.1 sigma 54-interacting transcriptional regulator [Brevibacillus sp. HD1.4A]RNB96179.1 PAS domain-containing protein [Brevibacillus parabrevis]UED71571.1 sigma 54-interacting transcriptional regulator [Brevibacillus sp. HD3.3A]